MLPLLVHTEYKNYLRGTPKRSLSLKHIHNIEVFFLSVRTKKGPQKRDMCLRSQISSLSPSNLRSVFVVVFVIYLSAVAIIVSIVSEARRRRARVITGIKNSRVDASREGFF